MGPVLALVLSAVAAGSSAPALSPAPRQLKHLSATPVALASWPVGSDDAPAAAAAASLVAALTKSKVGPIAGLPSSKFIAVGIMPPATETSAPAFAALAAKHGVTPADLASVGEEGYLLQLQAEAVILAAQVNTHAMSQSLQRCRSHPTGTLCLQTPTGLFYGYQTLRQLLADGSSVPSVRIVDWPSTGTREPTRSPHPFYCEFCWNH